MKKIDYLWYKFSFSENTDTPPTSLAKHCVKSLLTLSLTLLVCVCVCTRNQWWVLWMDSPPSTHTYTHTHTRPLHTRPLHTHTHTHTPAQRERGICCVSILRVSGPNIHNTMTLCASLSSSPDLLVGTAGKILEQILAHLQRRKPSSTTLPWVTHSFVLFFTRLVWVRVCVAFI